MEARPSVSLADRFKQALDSCDQSYAQTDQTPVVKEFRPRVTFSEPTLPWSPPQTLQVASAPLPQQPVADASCGSTLRAISIVVGVLLLAAAGWFVRKRIVEPFFQRRGVDEPDDEQLPLPPRRAAWSLPEKRVRFGGAKSDDAPRAWLRAGP